MNTISITGNLTESKGVKDTTNSRVARRAIAENFSKTESQFTDIEAWGDLAGQLDEMKKGTRVTVDGFLKHSMWRAKDGSERYGSCVVIKTIALAPWTGRDGETAPVATAAPTASVAAHAAVADDIDDGEIEF